MNKRLTIAFLAASTLILAGCQSTGGTTSSKNSTTSTCGDNQPDYTGAFASGVIDYTGYTATQKAELLGSMEGFAMKHNLAGIPIYDDAGYEQFSSRVQLPTTTYIPNYGFGVGDGSLNVNANMGNGSPISSSDTHPTYFHSYATEDTGTFNYWNSTGQDVAGKNGMITASYFGVKMNDAKDGYAWRGELSSTDDPIMLDSTGKAVAYTSGASSRFWRVKVKTGKDETTGTVYRYSCAPTSKYYSTYNDRKIVLEDYLTPFKAMLDNGLTRASGLIGDSTGFAGAQEYLYSSEGKRDWSNVGIQLNETEQSIDFTFVQPQTRYYARYNLSSGLYSPIPADFLTAIGGAKNFGTIGSGSDYTKNLDNLLSCGPYNVTYWEQGKETIYAKNANYFRSGEIKYDGFTEVVFSGTSAGNDAYKAYEQGQLDEVSIPTSKISAHKGDANVYKTLGSTTIKINANSCTKSEWEYYFGVNGKEYKHSSTKNYWNVKPIMANKDFLDGVYFCIDRAKLAEITGRNPALGYLSDAYMIDPDNNIAYRDTAAGKAALADYTNVDANGYSASMASTLFKSAMESLACSGDYEKGDTITLTFWFRRQETIDDIGATLKGFIENTFNQACPDYKLVIDEKVAGSDYTAAYTKMEQGDYDFAEGAISGNVLNPLEFMNVICNDSLSQGFTCNWGERTDVVNLKDPLIYDGKAWSYDALYTAANGAAIVNQGNNVEPISAGDKSAVNSTDSSLVDLQFAIPGLTNDKGDALISYDPKTFWVMAGADNGGKTSNYYNDLSSGLGKTISCVLYDTEVDLTISKSTLASLVKSLAEKDGFTADSVVIYAGFTCTYGQVSKLKTVKLTVPLSQIGITL